MFSFQWSNNGPSPSELSMLSGRPAPKILNFEPLHFAVPSLAAKDAACANKPGSGSSFSLCQQAWLQEVLGKNPPSFIATSLTFTMILAGVKINGAKIVPLAHPRIKYLAR